MSQREIKSDSNELLALSKYGFSKGEIDLVGSGIKSSILTMLNLRFLLDINR